MIYLGNLTKITDTKYSIGLTHYVPFDSVNGMNKTPEELKLEGILVDNIPEPKRIEGKSSAMYINPTNKEIFYEYVDIPKTQENLMQERMRSLEQSNAEMMAMIATMATPKV